MSQDTAAKILVSLLLELPRFDNGLPAYFVNLRAKICLSLALHFSGCTGCFRITGHRVQHLRQENATLLQLAQFDVNQKAFFARGALPNLSLKNGGVRVSVGTRFRSCDGDQ
jgi:hypothetical protein